MAFAKKGLQELASLPHELGERLREHHPALRGLGLPLDDLSFKFIREAAHPGGRQLDPTVEVLDERLDTDWEFNGKVFTGRLGRKPANLLFDRICRERD